MANKRMFSLNVVDTDRFLEMPISARLLYYELGMRADDDGFVDSWKKILLFTGLKEDDMRLLVAKSFIIPFESGVIVIKHWRMNNYLQNDRKKSTTYQEELKMLDISSGGEYFLKEKLIDKELNDVCIQNGSDMYTQYSIDKNSIDKNSIEYIDTQEVKTSSDISNKKHKYGEYKNVLLTDKELEKLKEDYSNYEQLIKYLDEYIEMKGYKAKSHNLAIRKWVVDAVKEYRKKHQVDETTPDWFNKDLKNEPPTEEEKKEMQELLDNALEEIKNIKK